MNFAAIEDIIQDIDVSKIPQKYIYMLRVRNMDGEEEYITGERLYSILNNPSMQKFSSAFLYINTKQIRYDIFLTVEEIFQELGWSMDDF